MATILIIDNSPTIIYCLRRALSRDGHQVDELSSFVDLARHLRTSRPDLILLDLQMPALSGQALGRFIRQLEGEHIPILIHSSQGRREMNDAARQFDHPRGVCHERLDG